MFKQKNSQESEYFNYLNEIGNGKQSIVIDNTIVLLESLAESYNKLSVADFGCFNGIMLATIYKNLSDNLKRNVSLTGFDSDKTAIRLGRSKFPFIKFVLHDLIQVKKQDIQYDVVISSNVLHEIYSSELPNKTQANKKVKLAFLNICKLLKDGGYLVFMDGLLPNNFNKIIKIKFIDQNLEKSFYKFAKRYRITDIHYTKNSRGHITISIKDLTMFLTKYRYLEKSFWTSESKQIYAYYTREDFEKLFHNAELEIKNFWPQPIPITENLVKKIKFLNQPIPSKNVLIQAQKVQSFVKSQIT